MMIARRVDITEEEEAKGLEESMNKMERSDSITKMMGVLEVHHNRGVIYFHPDGELFKDLEVMTYLRIGGLQKPIPMDKGFQLDVYVERTNDGTDYCEYKNSGAVLPYPRQHYRSSCGYQLVELHGDLPKGNCRKCGKEIITGEDEKTDEGNED